jgi:serine/threonine protein phosphatase PrpC
LARSPNIVEASSIGARDLNEDRVGHWTAPEAVLMAVADGLGGHLHGELAAQLAVDVLGASFLGEARPKLADPGQFLPRALSAGHAAIMRVADEREYVDSPRTVIATCVVQDGRAFWTHVGDCRFYLVRTGRIIVRTRDHTVVQRLVDEGRIPEEMAGTHPYRNRLLQCIGGIQTPAIEPVASVPLAADDILLLCSDGFWGPLTPGQMLHALASRPLDEAIAELVEAAIAAAGPECDNVSAVAMIWRD